MMTRVGVIGLGAMGQPIAQQLLKHGHQVTVHDLRPEPVESLSKRGARRAGTPREVAAMSDLTLVIVEDDAQVVEVCLGADGLLAGAARDSVIAILSSVSPDTCRTVAARAEAAGVHVVDAPMMRGAVAAEDGNLLLMLGGDPQVVERCASVFRVFAPDLCHLGPLGTGQIGKAVNNLLLWASVAAIHEGVGIARALGVDLGALREALQRSSANSWVLGEWDRICRIPRWWHQKDLGGFLSLAEKVGDPALVTSTLKELTKPLRPEQEQGLFAP